MTKYLINDDDTVRIDQTIYKIDISKPENDFLNHKPASKNYDSRLIENGVDAEIFQDGNDQNTTALMQGDIIASKQEPEIAFILIYNQLMPMYKAEYALDAYSKHDFKVVKLPSQQLSIKAKQEFDKYAKKMTQDISTLKRLVECAENEAPTIVDGTTYPASHGWYEVAQLALDLADQQEWFERYEDKYEN